MNPIISTAPGTELVTLSVNNEDPPTGWVWELAGAGKHNHLFEINGRTLSTVGSYVWPGDKQITLRTTGANGIVVDSEHILRVQDRGIDIAPTEHIEIPIDLIDYWTDDFSFHMSFFAYEYDSDIDLITDGVIPHIVVRADGRLIIHDDRHHELYRTDIGYIRPNVWCTLHILRSQIGEYVYNTYYIDGVQIYQTMNNYLPEPDLVPIQLIRRDTGYRGTVLSNVTLDMDKSRILFDNLRDTIGKLVTTGVARFYNVRWDGMDIPPVHPWDALYSSSSSSSTSSSSSSSTTP